VRSGRALPGHGDEWEALRRGGAEAARRLAGADAALRTLVASMLEEAPAARAAAEEVEAACLAKARSRPASAGRRTSRLVQAAKRRLGSLRL
jgi:hypothetical protein